MRNALNINSDSLFHFPCFTFFALKSETETTAETADSGLPLFQKVKQKKSETESETESETAVTISHLHIYTFLPPLVSIVSLFFGKKSNIRNKKEKRRPPGTKKRLRINQKY